MKGGLDGDTTDETTTVEEAMLVTVRTLLELGPRFFPKPCGLPRADTLGRDALTMRGGGIILNTSLD
jgi:hypothetical protein